MLSIIIPVYNVEDYIRKCLSSCLKLNLKESDYEIIVVDDGSPDNSLSIVKDVASKNSNIRIFSKPNGGLSSARNYGLERARGRYVWFIDSDDYIIPDIIPFILSKMEENKLDMYVINWQKVTTKNKYINDDNKHKIKSYSTVLDGSIFFPLLNNFFFAPRFIINKQFFLENNFSFKEGILYEDIELLPRVILKANRIMGGPDLVYFYLQRDGSILRSANYRLVEHPLMISAKYKKMSNINQFYEEVSLHLVKIAFHQAANSDNIGFRHLVLKYIHENNITNIYSDMTKISCIFNFVFNNSPKMLYFILNFRSRFKRLFVRR